MHAQAPAFLLHCSGVFVYSIATGDSALSDVWSSYFGNVNDQVGSAPALTLSVCVVMISHAPHMSHAHTAQACCTAFTQAAPWQVFGSSSSTVSGQQGSDVLSCSVFKTHQLLLMCQMTGVFESLCACRCAHVC